MCWLKQILQSAKWIIKTSPISLNGIWTPMSSASENLCSLGLSETDKNPYSAGFLEELFKALLFFSVTQFVRAC